MSEASTVADTGKTELGLSVEKGQVVVRFPEPRLWFAMDPQNALVIGEAIAKAAYEARFGKKPGEGSSVLSERTRQRIVTRAGAMLRSLLADRKPVDYIAASVTDAVLKEVA